MRIRQELYSLMNDKLATKEFQDLSAREICITNELQNRTTELINSVSASAQLHFKDLATFSNTKVSSKTEEELEIAHEQIKSLKQELHDAKQELHGAFQMLDFLSQEVNACYGIPVEIEKRQFNEDSTTARLNRFNQSVDLDVRLLRTHHGQMTLSLKQRLEQHKSGTGAMAPELRTRTEAATQSTSLLPLL